MGKPKGGKAASKRQAASAPKKPVDQLKSSSVGISHQHASKIRELLQNVDDTSHASDAKQSAQDLRDVYRSLEAHGFEHEDIRAAMQALKAAVTEENALDWLCINVPPARLPKRFAERSEAQAAAEAAAMTAAAAAQEAAAARTKREEASRAEAANKARILAQYAARAQGTADAESASASSDEDRIEDWELWGDPREVERRRAERKRAAQLSMLTDDERRQQLAVELKTAMDQAKAAKATGNKEHKRVAGEVIRALKLEITGAGFKEAEIQSIIADMRAAEPLPVPSAEARPPEALIAAGSHAEAPDPARTDDVGAGTEREVSPGMPMASSVGAAMDSWEDAAGAADGPGSPADGTNGTGTQDLSARSRAENGDSTCVGPTKGGDPESDIAPSAVKRGTDDGEDTFDAGALWDDEDGAVDALGTVAGEPGAAAANGGDASPLAAVPVRAVKRRQKPDTRPELPVGVPKSVLQQMCHKARPPWAAPRFNKASRPGEPFRYGCTIVFPATRARKKKGGAAGGDGSAPQEGPRTWRLPSRLDGWDNIQDAQNATALRALADLSPDLLQSFRLQEPFQSLWEQLQDSVAAKEDEEAEGSDRAAFIDSLLDRDRAEHSGLEGAGAAAARSEADDGTAQGDGNSHESRRAIARREATEAEAEILSARLRREQDAFQASPTGREWAERRSKLPVIQVRDQLLSALSRGDFAVLSGDTGCGKTTQVPQYILEAEIAAGCGAACQIVCTQPRRLAAISVAERVAVERAEPPPGERGSKLGYHVRLDPAISSDTRLTFCTTGILLRRLAGEPDLAGVSHIVVDEVHERSMQGDFLLALLRRLVAARRGRGAAPLKVVLMSATIDLDLLCNYFGGCPRMTAQGRTFPVEQFFLEDVYEMTNYRLEDGSQAALRGHRDRSFQRSTQKQGGKQAQLLKAGWGDDEVIQTDALNRFYDADDYRGYARHVHVNLARLDESAIDFDLIEDLVRHIDTTQDEGAILVFLPGMGEITNLCDRLTGSHHFKPATHWIIPLHSTVAPEDQKQAFVRPPPRVRKIVVATNIAETSLTIEDVVFVVDSGKMKERRFSAARGVSMLVLDAVSQASARQRRGRAGRVRPGFCYSLFTRPAFSRMPRFQIPEIMRVPLEELVLQIHLLELGTAEAFLAELLQPPPERAISAAISGLRVIGALEAEGLQRLTPLGVHLAQLPVEPRLGKLLVAAVFMGCLSAALTIAACLSYKAPFSTAFAAQEASDAARRHLASDASNCIASGQQSDHLVMLAAYNGWQVALDKGGPRLARDFVKRHSLSFVTLQMLRDMRSQFASMLADIRLIGSADGRRRGGRNVVVGWADDETAPWNVHAARGPVIKAALCAALYPQVACMDGASVASARPTWLDAGMPVSVHKSSVLHPMLTGRYLAPYLAYSEKMQTGSTFLRDVTVVPPLSLLLFGGRIEVHHDAGYILLDGVLKIHVAAQTAVLVKKLRTAWSAMMDDKVKRPQAPLTDTQARILDTTVGLLSETDL